MHDSSQNEASLLLPSLPNTLLVGLDTIALTPSANFLGFTQLPVGWHFLYAGAHAALATRTGYWFYVPSVVSKSKEWIRIFRWDPSSESLEPLLSQTEVSAWRSRLSDASNSEVHGRLLPYRIDPATVTATDASSTGAAPTSVDFGRLTNYITPALLDHLIGAESDILWHMSTAASAPEDREEIPGLMAEDRRFTRPEKSRVDSTTEPGPRAETGVVGEERELRFLGIDLKRTWREGALGRERTIDARDRSAALKRIMEGTKAWASSDDSSKSAASHQWGPILGTFQLTFLMVLLLSNWSCLQEWRRILELVLTSRQSVRQAPAFFATFLQVLQQQLERCADVEGGLFDVQGDGANFLKLLLRGFWEVLNEVEEQDGGIKGGNREDELDAGSFEDAHAAMRELEAWVAKEWGWVLNREGILRKGMIELEDGERVEVEMDDFDAEDERGEYAPMVVDLDES